MSSYFKYGLSIHKCIDSEQLIVFKHAFDTQPHPHHRLHQQIQLMEISQIVRISNQYHTSSQEMYIAHTHAST